MSDQCTWHVLSRITFVCVLRSLFQKSTYDEITVPHGYPEYIFGITMRNSDFNTNVIPVGQELSPMPDSYDSTDYYYSFTLIFTEYYNVLW